MKPSFSAKRRESGQALLLVIVSLSLFVLGALGLAIDGAQLYAHRQMAQTAADAAAQAGIMSIFDGTNATAPNPFATGSPPSLVYLHDYRWPDTLRLRCTEWIWSDRGRYRYRYISYGRRRRCPERLGDGSGNFCKRSAQRKRDIDPAARPVHNRHQGQGHLGNRGYGAHGMRLCARPGCIRSV